MDINIWINEEFHPRLYHILVNPFNNYMFNTDTINYKCLCIVSVLSVYCQCIVSVLSVYCQCIVSVIVFVFNVN